MRTDNVFIISKWVEGRKINEIHSKNWFTTTDPPTNCAGISMKIKYGFALWLDLLFGLLLDCTFKEANLFRRMMMDMFLSTRIQLFSKSAFNLTLLLGIHQDVLSVQVLQEIGLGKRLQKQLVEEAQVQRALEHCNSSVLILRRSLLLPPIHLPPGADVKRGQKCTFLHRRWYFLIEPLLVFEQIFVFYK